MKLMIISDLHGSAYAARALDKRVQQEAPEHIILLGDLLYHGPRNNLPEGYSPKEALAVLNSWTKRVVAVRGNCDAEVDQMVLDFPCMADYALIQNGEHLLYATHGHVAGMTPECPPALPAGSALLSGHTHCKRICQVNGILFVNPGSPSLPKDAVASYAVANESSFTLKTLEGTTISQRGWE